MTTQKAKASQTLASGQCGVVFFFVFFFLVLIQSGGQDDVEVGLSCSLPAGGGEGGDRTV